MDQTIETTGIGTVNLIPDSVEITFAIASENADFAAVSALCAEAQDKIKKALIRAGLKAKDCKTGSYSVDTVYDNARNEAGEYTRVFRGYAARLEMTANFVFDTKRLGKVLTEISESGAPCEYRLKFYASDPSSAGKEAIRLAVCDAREKAAALAEAAGVEIESIREIRYTGSSGAPYSETDFRPAARAVCMSAPDLAPSDVKVAERVSMSFCFRAK